MRSHFASSCNERHLLDCNGCFNVQTGKLLSAYIPSTPGECPGGRCCRWNMESSSPAVEHVELPKHYPTNRDNPNTGNPPTNQTAFMNHAKPMRQQFDWLIQGLTFTYKNACSTNKPTMWYKQSFTAYLCSTAINQEVYDGVRKAASAKKNDPNSNPQFIPPLWLMSIPI